MATAGSVQAKIVGLITKANETTGNTDVDLTTAVDALVKGYGKGGSGGGEQPTLFAPFLTVKSSDELQNAVFTMAANEQNGGFAVSLSLKVNGEIVENPYTATEVGTYTVEAIASAENFADGVNTQIVEVTEMPTYSEGLKYEQTTLHNPTRKVYAVSIGTCTDKIVRVAPMYNGVVVEVVHRLGNNDTMESVVLPETITHYFTAAFSGAKALLSIDIPNTIISIGSSAFSNCDKLEYIKIPKSVTTIESEVFAYCDLLQYVDFSDHESVPVLNNANAFYTNKGYCEVRVPSALYDEWVAATNWASLASKIVAV